MAKKKETEIVDAQVENASENTEVAENTGVTAAHNDLADKILKLYPDHEELYIDKFGGAYTSSHDGAVKFTNPYFKD